MKKRINLLNKPNQYFQYEKIFKRIRKLTIYLLILFFVVFLPIFLILFNKEKEIDRLYQEKKSLLEYITANKQIEADFIYLKSKHQQLVQAINEDVNFLPYYNILLNSLKESSPSPKLDQVIISKDRSVSFTLIFNDKTAMVNFLKFAESDKFINNFNHLFISKFNLTEKGKAAELLFLGQFKLL